MLLIVLSMIICVLSLLCYFLISELFKKFGFWKSWQQHSKNQFSWIYHGDRNPDMYTIKIQGTEKFQALIGFDFSVGPIKSIGYDVFGYMESDDDGCLYFSTYLGTGPVEFIFLIQSIPAEGLIITCGEYTDNIVPKYTFAPHWWQRIGIGS